MARLELKELTKTFGSDTVVDHVDLAVAEGEFVVLLGPSGCGKTTILRMVAGLEQITAGELWLDGKIVNAEPPDRRNVGMVFQNYALYPHMTVSENLSFGLRSRRRRTSRRNSNKEVRELVRQTAELLEISHVLDHRPKQLSGGQRQRVALGRALIRDPAVFLMDEPLSNLDANLRDRVRMELTRIHDQFPVTTIYVTHDQGEALTLADRVVVMNEGRICQVGAPKEVYDHPADTFVAGFMGAPGMNLWTLPWERDGDRVALGDSVELSWDFAEALFGAGSEVTLGIRPEHLCLSEDLTAPGATVSCQIDLVEQFGSHLLAHGRIGGGHEHPVVVRLAAKSPLRRGEHLRLAAPPDQVHLFHVDTCGRLGPCEPVPVSA